MKVKDIQELVNNMITDKKDFCTIGELRVQAYLHSESIHPTALFTLHNVPVMKFQDLKNGKVELYFPEVGVPTSLTNGYIFNNEEAIEILLSEDLKNTPNAKLIYSQLSLSGKENN